MKVTAGNWQSGAAAYRSSRTARNQKTQTKADAGYDPRDIDTDILETSAASLMKTGTDSRQDAAAKEVGSNSPFKVKASGPENSVGELAAMLARAETLMDVQMVLSKAMRTLADLKMAAVSSEGKEAKKYAQQIKRMEKLIKRIHKKVKQLSKEENLEEKAKKAAKKAEVEKEKQIRQELKARRKKRRRDEKEYALKEQATDGKNALNDTISSVLGSAFPSSDVSAAAGFGSDIMAGDFSGIDMGSLDIMV